MDSQATSTGMFSTFPQPSPISFPQSTTQTPVQLYQSKPPLQKFLRTEPKVLGIIQIMNALMIFSLGMILILVPMNNFHYFEQFLLHSGYVIWGSAFFIISGTLSIVAEKRTTNTVVQSSLAMNTVSSVVAGLGIILSSNNLPVITLFFRFNPCGNLQDSCDLTSTLLLGINVILLILTVFEFAISIAVSAFGCKTTCCVQSSVTLVIPPSSRVPQNPC